VQPVGFVLQALNACRDKARLQAVPAQHQRGEIGQPLLLFVGRAGLGRGIIGPRDGGLNRATDITFGLLASGGR
jgi:hypothetical protein